MFRKHLFLFVVEIFTCEYSKTRVESCIDLGFVRYADKLDTTNNVSNFSHHKPLSLIQRKKNVAD